MIKKIAALFLISIALSGCLPTATKNSQKPDSGDFVKGSVVKGFPNLPLYPKSKTVETYTASKKYGGSFIASDDVLKVVEFYNKSLPAAGLEVGLVRKSETNYVFDIKNGALTGQIIVNTAADGKQTAITIWTQPR